MRPSWPRPLALLAAVLLALVVVRPTLAAESPAETLRAIAERAGDGAATAASADVTAMQAEWAGLDKTWEQIEDQVRAANPAGYVQVESALDGLKDAVEAPTVDRAAVKLAFEQLERQANALAATLASGQPTEGAATTAATPADVLSGVDAAATALARGDMPEAQEQLAGAVRAWPAAEGAVATRSSAAYEAIERDLGRATSALAQPADQAAAKAALDRLRATLAPFAERQSYTAFDVAAVLLREGLEALLIIVALLAFLSKSGNADKRGWVWAGGALGVLASVGVAFALQAVFNQAAAGTNRELLEGVTGLFAAVMLFYISYWLHSKASLAGWKRYIDARTTAALAGGRLFGLAALAFLTVFREGAETAVFYLGMAPSLAVTDLLLGLAMATAVLLLAAVLMLGLGVKLPLRLFFRLAGLLVYYLGFKFVGTGIHALQVAGALPTSPAELLPAVPAAGIYPTWETLVPQVALLVLALALFVYLRSREAQPQAAAA